MRGLVARADVVPAKSVSGRRKMLELEDILKVHILTISVLAFAALQYVYPVL
jgi:hypothetical protein